MKKISRVFKTFMALFLISTFVAGYGTRLYAEDSTDYAILQEETQEAESVSQLDEAEIVSEPEEETTEIAETVEISAEEKTTEAAAEETSEETEVTHQAEETAPAQPASAASEEKTQNTTVPAVNTEEKADGPEEEAVDVSGHPLRETKASDNEVLLSRKQLSDRTLSLIDNESQMSLMEAPGEQQAVTADGMSIEKITVRWLSRSTGEDEPAGFNDLVLSTDSDLVASQQFQIDFALSGKDDHAPGAVEIVFPAYIWLDRNGKEPGYLTMSVPEEPETGADFAWRRVDDYIVVTNVRKLSAASKVMLQGTYRGTKAQDMVDIDVAEGSDYYDAANKGVSDWFTATINLTTPKDNVISMDSNRIRASLNTYAVAASATKSALNTSSREYYVYHTEDKAKAAGLPQALLDNLNGDPADYSFIKWYVSGSATGSQPFDMTVSETFDGTVTHYVDAMHTQIETFEAQGQFLGMNYTNANGEQVLCNPSADGQSLNATLFSGYSTKTKSAYVWSAYRKDSFPEEGTEYTLSNSQTITVKGWDDLIETTKEASADVPFRLPVVYTINKVWNDDNDAAGHRPDQQYYSILYYDGNGEHNIHAVMRPDGEGNWTYTWDDEGQDRSFYVYECDNTGFGYSDRVQKGQTYLYRTFNHQYDEDGDLCAYDWERYKLTDREYNSDTHTYTYTNTYETDHVVRPLVPFKVGRARAVIGKYTTNSKDSNQGYMATSDRNLNILRRGNDVVIDYTISGEAEVMEYMVGDGLDKDLITSYGKKNIRVELEDNYGPDTIMSVKDNVLLLDSQIKLTVDDADIDYVYLNTHSFLVCNQPDKYSSWSYSGIGRDKMDSAPDEELWGYINGAWKKFATVDWKTGKITITDSSATLSGRYVYFPHGVERVKTTTVVPATEPEAQRVDGTRMSYRVGIRLRGDSETIQNRLEAVFNLSDYGMCTLDNYDIINVYLEGQTNPELYEHNHARAYLHGRNHRVAVDTQKSFELVENDTVKRRLKLHTKVDMVQQSNILTSSEYQEAKNDGLIPDTTEGIWYDLLPMSVEPDLNSVQLKGGDKILDKYIIPNYGETGRIMLVVKIAAAENVDYLHKTDSNVLSHDEYRAEYGSAYPYDPTYPKEGYYNTHTIEFDAYYSWDQARIYGLDNVRNVAAYETLNESSLGNIAGWSGEPDDPQANNNQRAMNAVGADKETMTNIDDKREAEDKEHAFVYSGAKLKYENPDFSAETQLRKYVTRDGLGKWSSGQDGADQVNVHEGGYYTYMLYVASGSDTTTKNIILVDALDGYVPTENDGNDYKDGQWKGTFESIDYSELLEKYGVVPSIWYYVGADTPDVSGRGMGFGEPSSSSSSGYYESEDKDAVVKNLQSDPNWVNDMPADKSSIKAIAIDARYKTDGTEFELMKDKTFYVTVRMKAPVFETTGEAGDPFNADEELRKDPANNDHAYNNINLSCMQVDTLAREVNSYIFYNYTRVGITPFELNISKEWDDADNNDGLRPSSVTVELIGNGKPTGQTLTLPIKDENGKDQWSGKISHILQYDDEGNWIEYTFKETTDDPNFSLMPYLMSYSRDGDDVTITNKHAPEKTSILFSKKWVGDDAEESRAFRPDHIVVRLMADGVFTGKSAIVKPDRDGNWSGIFENLPKYNNPTGTSGAAHKIEYTVQEEQVYKYLDTYEVKENGTTEITNTFYPFGDLKVSKTVTNVTDASKDKIFTFSLALKDAEGNELTDKYPYFILEEGERIEKVINEDKSVSYHKLKEDEELAEDRTPDQPDGTIGNGDSFRIKGGQSLIVLDIPSESMYEVEEEELAGFTLVGLSGTDGSIKAGGQQDAGFTNRYNAEGSYTASLKKTLEGRKMVRNQFRFELLDLNTNTAEGDDHPVIRTTSADADGNATFGPLKYTEADNGKTYTYQLREVDREKPGYTYDKATYTLEVTVADNGDGTMTCTPVYKDSKGKELTNIPADILFENKYHAEGSVTLRAWKQLPGGTLEANQFTFELWGEKASAEGGEKTWSVLQTKKNDENGLVVWDTFNFDEKDVGKTFLYVAKEVKGTDSKVNYDGSLKGYELSIADNGDGTLAITQTNVTVVESKDDQGNVTYEKGEETTNLPLFINTLEPGNLEIIKKTDWEGSKEPDGNLPFSFTVTLIPFDEELEFPSSVMVQLSDGVSGQKPYSSDNAPTPLTDAEKREQEIELDENRSFTITLKAGQKLSIKDLPAGTAYQVSEAVPESWTLEAQSAVGEVPSNATASAVMNNKYEPGKATATIVGSKLLDKKPSAAGKFAFELKDITEGVEGYTNHEDKVVVNEAGGFIQKSEVFDTPGTYTFTMQEIPKLVESADGKDITWVTDEDVLRTIQFDESVYTITIVVTSNTGEGGETTLTAATPVITKDGEPVEKMQFNNSTRPGSLQITKVGEGLTDANKDTEFEFKIKLTNPAGMPLSNTGSMLWYAEEDEDAAEPAKLPEMTEADEPEDASPQAASASDDAGTSDEETGDNAAEEPAQIAPMLRLPMAMKLAANAPLLGAEPPAQNYGKVLQSGTFGGAGRVVNGIKQGSVKYTIYDSGYMIIEPTNGISGSFNNSNGTIGGAFNKVKYCIAKGTCYANGSISHLFCTGSGIPLSYADLRGIDVTYATSMQEFWDWTKNLQYLDISTWSMTSANTGYLLYQGNLQVVKLGPGFMSNNSSFFRTSSRFVCLEKPQLGQKTLTSFCNGKKLGEAYAGTWVRVGYKADFTIAFDPNGGTGEMQNHKVKMADESTWTLPECEFENDLNFAGWSTDPNAILPEYADGGKYTGAALGGQTVTLYAIWMSEDSFLLHYDAAANGGYSRTQWQRVNGPDDTVTMPTASHPSNYEFLGWNTAPDGSGNYYSGTVDGSAFNAAPGSTVTLYAQFLDPSKRGKLEVQHYQQNASCTGYDGPVAREINTYNLDQVINVTEKAGPHDYKGFITPAEYDRNGTKYPVTTDITMVKGGVIIRYYYNRTHYTLKFHANEGEGTMADITMTGGVSQKLPVNQFTKENSIFVGWNTEEDGSGTNYGDGQNINSIAGDGATVDLYAQWYSLDDAGSAEPSNGEYTVSCKAGERIVFPVLPAGTVYEVTEVNLPDGWTLIGIEDEDPDRQASGEKVILSAERIQLVATNRYAASGSASFTAHKALPGETISSGQFTFELYDEAGNLIETASNSAADEAEQVAGEGDSTVANPWYGTAPVRFSDINYTSQGIYKYTIKETAGSDRTISYDTHTENVTVLVTDRGDGRLNTEVHYDSDDAYFVNRMSDGDLEVTKILRNATAASKDTNFTFILHLFDSQGNEITAEYPVIMPDGSESTVTSGGTVTIKGDQSFTVKGLPHKSTYIVAEVPAPGFEKVAEDNTEGTILAGTTAHASIENAYTVSTSEGGAKLVAKKIFYGGDIEEEQFAFRLSDDKGETIEEVFAGTDGTVAFSEIMYSLDDNGKRFIYYIEELPGDDPYITYDTHRETVTVIVKDNGKGVMESTIEYDEDGAVFTNESLGSLEITKTLENKEHVEGRTDPATFVFSVDITYKDEVILSNVYSMIFTEAGSQSITIEDLPVGAIATVAEIYAGGNYKVTGNEKAEAVIVPYGKVKDGLAEQAAVNFTNTHNGDWKEGGSVTNSIGADGSGTATYSDGRTSVLAGGGSVQEE